MANISLHCHPGTPSKHVQSCDVDYEIQPDGRLWLRYFLECRLSDVILPVADGPARADGLWQTSCFELFLRDACGDGYFEYNFAPSREWAAYRFDGYRSGMADLMTAAPDIGCDASDTHFALEATIDLPFTFDGGMDAAFTAVVHERGDFKSYWSVRHPSGQPDFHHKDCFAVKLAPPERI